MLASNPAGTGESQSLKTETASTCIGQYGCYPQKCRSQKRIRGAMKRPGALIATESSGPKKKLFDSVNFFFFFYFPPFFPFQYDSRL